MDDVPNHLTIHSLPLTKEDFAPFGDVIELGSIPDFLINQGLCGRHHDLANMDFSPDIGDGRVGISLFDAAPRDLPYSLDVMERHPLGSQAFLPMHEAPFLVIVAEDNNGYPATPQAFLTQSGQGINFHRNVWHGVLTPLANAKHRSGLFAVIDRIGEGNNLQEFWFDEPYIIEG